MRLGNRREILKNKIRNKKIVLNLETKCKNLDNTVYEDTKTTNLMGFTKLLFSIWDSKNRGYLSLKDIMVNLLSLGISLSIEFGQRVISLIMRKLIK